jgi:hypothetical protein
VGRVAHEDGGLTMLATSTRIGSRREGRITIMAGTDADGYTRYGYRYARGTGRARHDLTVHPHGGALAIGRLGDALSDLAVQAAESADPGPHTWRLTREADGWSVEMVAGERAA